MNYLVILLLTTLVYGMDNDDGVINFNLGDAAKSHAKATLKGFTYTNCGHPSTDILDLTALSLGPDPLSFPGSLIVAFQALVRKTVDAPLAANVLLERRIGSSYIKIPCIEGIGSCKYDDLCELLAGATCPPPFVNNKIPCKCPFTQGNYTLPKATFDVDAAVFPPGDYKAQGNVTYNGAAVGCVALTVSVE